MLDLAKSQLIETRVANLLSTVSTVEEGTPMVHTLENGAGVVKPATGAANEMYAGMAFGRPNTPGVVPRVDALVVPATSTYTVTLTKTKSGSDIQVVAVAANGTRTVLAAGSASNANEYSISGQVITVNSSKAGLVLLVTYKYAISYQEAVMRYNFNGFTATTLGSIGTVALLTTGEAWIDNYDVTVDWYSITGAVPVTLGSGVYTIGGSGTTLDALVTHAPDAANPLLGLRFHP